jgi:hypothetical protein
MAPEIAQEARESEYEEAGVWECCTCGARSWVVHKIEVVAEAFACPDHSHVVDPRDHGIPCYVVPEGVA